MTHTARRITLIQGSADSSNRTWTRSLQCPSRCIQVPEIETLRQVLRDPVSRLAQDVDRVILDGSTTLAQYVDLLARLPQDFTGDVMLIREDGGSYVSAVGRDNGRVLYSLAPRDVHFYLEVHGLLEGGRRLFLSPLPSQRERRASRAARA